MFRKRKKRKESQISPKLFREYINYLKNNVRDYCNNTFIYECKYVNFKEHLLKQLHIAEKSILHFKMLYFTFSH